MALNDNILSIINNESPAIIEREIAARVKARRLEMDLTQAAFAKRAGIPLATYRRFELTGAASLRNLILISVALGMTADFEALFSQRRFRDIDEVIRAGEVKARRRGRRNE